MNPIMGQLDLQQELKSSNSKNEEKADFSSSQDSVLCKHCKRTASNGIRCLGMCVADNDY